MALQKPTYVGVTDIMKAYDSINGNCQYYYSVWHSQKDIAFQYVGEDARQARQYLEDNLEAMAQAGNDNLLYLKFHPVDKKSKYISYKTDIIANTPICCVAPSERPEIAGTPERDRSGDTGYQMYKTRLMLEELPATLDIKINEAIERRLLEAEETDDLEEPIDPTQRIVGIINGIAGNPQIMGLIGQVLNFLKPNLPPIRINGMNENNNVPQVDVSQIEKEPGNEADEVTATELNDDMLNAALNRLHQHCRLDVDLTLLADMADNNPVLFNSMLGMLRQK